MVDQRDSHEYTPLHIAIQNNDIVSVRLLLKHGADPKLWFPRDEVVFTEKSTSVTEAADLGFLDILKLLMEDGGPVPSIALHMATESGQLECVKAIFAWMVDNNRTEFDDGVAKSTAVAWALKSVAVGEADNLAVEDAFLKVMVPDFMHDDYPIRNCVRKGPYENARKARIEIARLLLEAGADVNASDRGWGRRLNPLHQMAQEGNRAREIFDMLLDRNAEVDSLHWEGPDYTSGRTPFFQAVLAADDIYFAERLLEKAADVTHIDKFGNTLLHASTSNSTPACSAIMSLLLSHGLSSCATNSEGRTTLHEASRNGNVEAVKLLLRSNRDLINCKTPEGLIALHFAADGPSDQHRIDVSTVLLEYGADINALTGEGWTVLHRAVRGNRYDTTLFISFLLENGADITATDKVESLGNIRPDHISSSPTSADLQAVGVARQVRDSLLHPVLDKAHYTTTRTLSLLLDNGANIECRDAQGDGRTPLRRAAGTWDAGTGVGNMLRNERLTELINRGADIDARDNAGLGLEDRVKNKGYTITMTNGKVVKFEKIPGPVRKEQLAGHSNKVPLVSPCVLSSIIPAGSNC